MSEPTPATDATPPTTPSSLTALGRRGSSLRRLRLSPLTVVALLVLAIWLVAIVLGPVLQTHDPLQQSADRLVPPGAAHLLGTDALGRDVFSRLLAGARLSIPVALVLVTLSMTVGATLGALAGYLGRAVDEAIMRVADIVFAFPTMILAMVIAAALGPSLFNAVLAILLVSWPQYARVTRSLVLGARDLEYVIAGRLLGSGAARSLVRDILPNVFAPILVLATLDLGSAILTLSGLSFLGLGSVPPTPEWGSMVADGMEQFSSWWIATSAGLAILSVVLAFNLVGDALRDLLDPKTSRVVRQRA